GSLRYFSFSGFCIDLRSTKRSLPVSSYQDCFYCAKFRKIGQVQRRTRRSLLRFRMLPFLIPVTGEHPCAGRPVVRARTLKIVAMKAVVVVADFNSAACTSASAAR